MDKRKRCAAITEESDLGNEKKRERKRERKKRERHVYKIKENRGGNAESRLEKLLSRKTLTQIPVYTRKVVCKRTRLSTHQVRVYVYLLVRSRRMNNMAGGIRVACVHAHGRVNARASARPHTRTHTHDGRLRHTAE